MHTKPESRLRRWVTKNRGAGSTSGAPAESSGDRAVTGTYAPLHTYLANRYANTVVLTLAEIEDLLGCALPRAAHGDAGWWANADSHLTTGRHSRSCTLANRIPSPNLAAHTVIFELQG